VAILLKTKILILIISLIFSSDTFAAAKKWESSLPEHSVFAMNEKLQRRIDFWVDIYSKYTTTQGVFHNVDKPEIIYGTVDITDIMNNSVLNNSEKTKRSRRLIDDQRTQIISQFKMNSKSKMRLQMGLKDRMQKAFYFSGKYLPMMEKVFKERNLPIELTRIVFVESSFNVFAQSKVGASGLWQIMPSVGRAEGYLHKYYDKRNHPYYSTILAADMLKQNYKSLKSWPLAVTAYNHGLTGVRRMKAKAGSDRITQLISSHKKTGSWGFASENFYACFLAVLEVERNAHDLFGPDLIQSKKLKVQNIYLKKKIAKSKVLMWYGGSLQKFKNYNPHLRLAEISRHKFLPAGVPLVVPEGLVL
jgi:membrane-bound lytic murein transglycosylase D